MLSLKSLAACLVVLGVAAGPARAANPIIVIETNYGTIKAELFEDKAPETVKSVLTYVDEKHYDGLIFHRCIDGFMLQGGGYYPGMRPKDAKRTSKNEAGNGLSNIRGTLAMARTRDPDSASSQFFINLADNSRLDRSGNTPATAGYTVFGRVIEGMDVVDKIAKVEKTKNADDELAVPKQDVVIKSIRRADKK
ncbi:MAG: peptidylprolyl isomerase [Gemmataceae bacterium]|nr:peptidylprolyl isomerase [Gemmataceae bacterium]